MRFLTTSLFVVALLALTGCPPQRFPFEDRWVLDETSTEVDATLGAIDSDGAILAALMAGVTPANAGEPRQLELAFSMSGAVTCTLTLAKQATTVEGEYTLAGQSSGEHRLKLAMGKKRQAADARVKVSADRQTMTMWVTRDGKEAETKWMRAK